MKCVVQKLQLQKLSLNHSSNVDFKHFAKNYEKYTAKPYSFLLNDITLPSNDTLRFRENLVDGIYSK